MDVPLSMMRMSIKQIYANEEWSHKVDMMHRNQVTAIYLRYKACRFIPEKFKHKEAERAASKKEEYEQTRLNRCGYTCHDCGVSYIRDNPCLTECEYCGSENITKEYLS